MSNSLVTPCPAKINLYLEAGEKREDGFHQISTIMQAVDLRDELTVEDRPGTGARMECDLPGLPVDSRNLCVKAAEFFLRTVRCEEGVHISLRKSIPVAAGLGGGSSDAAGILRALNRLWTVGLSDDRLREMAAHLGSDVPFFIGAGTARCTGRGERVELIEHAPSLAYVLVTPPVKVSTEKVYDSMATGGAPAPLSARAFLKLLESGDPAMVAAHLYNRLEQNSGSYMRGVADLKARLLARGALGALMSGSGPSVFAIAGNLSEAARICAEIGKEVGEEFFVHYGLTNVQGGERRRTERVKDIS